MRTQEDFESEQKRLLIKLILTLIIIIITCYIIHIKHNEYISETSEAFKNSEVLVCYDTLIVSDANWHLVDDHLINNNSAGYLLIDNCRITKD